MSEAERIQKAIARTGLYSRRQVETLIREQRVQVNGKVVELGCKVSDKDNIFIDGKRIELEFADSLETEVILLNKPEGLVCTRSDERDRDTVYACLPPPEQGRWISVGRLDINTSGLLLFTNDGELAHKLMHPQSQIEREYAVRVFGEVDKSILDNLRQGIELEDGFAHFDEIREGGGRGINRWFHVVLKEGRKREVRRLWESQGLRVSRLIRTRFGHVTLPEKLREGEIVQFKSHEIERLRNLCQLSAQS